jgi:hypothetical protein
MLYNQPYDQPTNPNASYNNGNPETATQGSIPPAAAIEYPQREIVEVINDAGLVPSNADLKQLAKAIQNSKLIGYQDAGVPNIVAITTNPTFTALSKFMTFIVSLANNNTGPSELVVNGISAPITHPDISSLVGGELLAGALACFSYDGSEWQLVWSQRVAGEPIYLTSPKTLYVNGSTGSDTLYDGTSATVSGTHGPFATIQRAVNASSTYNLNGYNFTIMVAAGVYAGVFLPPTNGEGTVFLIGTSQYPSLLTSCQVLAPSGGCAFFQTGGNYNLSGFTVSTPAGALDGVACDGGVCRLSGTMVFNWCQRAHVSSFTSGALWFSANMNIVVTGPASYHILAAEDSTVNVDNPPAGIYPELIITTSVSIGCWIQSYFGAIVQVYYQGMTGYSAVSGSKFNCYGGGIISSLGSGVNYYPGNSAGTDTDGYYY